MPRFLNSLGPRRFGEHKWHDKLKKIATTDLRGGDILIAKEWSNRAFDVAAIRLGQAIFSHHAEASSQSEHVLLNCEDAEASTIESLSLGLLIADRINMRDHVVYSCRDEDLRWEAVYVAETLAGKRKIDASNDYRGIIESTITTMNPRSNTGPGRARRRAYFAGSIKGKEPWHGSRNCTTSFIAAAPPKGFA